MFSSFVVPLPTPCETIEGELRLFVQFAPRLPASAPVKVSVARVDIYAAIPWTKALN